jgi:hypothetical protein
MEHLPPRGMSGQVEQEIINDQWWNKNSKIL